MSERKTSDAQRKAVAKYDAENTKMFTFKMNKKTDADIITKLASVPNMQSYIKELIRADIAKDK